MTEIWHKKPKNSTIKLLPGGQGATEKRPKNSTFKPLSTTSVLCMKIQGGHGPLLPDADAHVYSFPA